MGIYDRDYYRGDGNRYLGALWPSGHMCKWLIGINVLVFFVQMATRGGALQQALILDPEAVLEGQVWRLLTYAFLHDPATIWHIFFNMLFLWWFGSDLESLYGPKEFLAFYLTSAFLGGVAYTALAPFTGWGLCLGASGAITAVLVLYAFHFPHHRIYIFFVLPVPIWLFVAFQVAQDTFLFVSQTRTGTAVTVHLAGALFGFLYHTRHWHLLSLGSTIWSWRGRSPSTRLRVYRPEEDAETVSVSAVPRGQDLDEHLEAKLDAILEKVARTGQNSLTESERKVLLQASEIYKRKRT